MVLPMAVPVRLITFSISEIGYKFFCKFRKNVILSRAGHLFDGEIMCMVKDESKEEIRRGDRGDQSHP